MRRKTRAESTPPQRSAESTRKAALKLSAENRALKKSVEALMIRVEKAVDEHGPLR